MKTLGSFRDWLLIEMPMKTEDDLPEEVYVTIITHKNAYSSVVEINFTDKNGKIIYVNQDEQRPLGEVQIVQRNGFWDMEWVRAEQGYGPLIYDIAIEFASQNSLGLTASLYTGNSNEAVDVWIKYSTRRDVTKTPLPEKYRRESPDHPTSFIYSKKLERLSRLREAGKLIERN